MPRAAEVRLRQGYTIAVICQGANDFRAGLVAASPIAAKAENHARRLKDQEHENERLCAQSNLYRERRAL
jgi:hypothetical protein